MASVSASDMIVEKCWFVLYVFCVSFGFCTSAFHALLAFVLYTDAQTLLRRARATWEEFFAAPMASLFRSVYSKLKEAASRAFGPDSSLVPVLSKFYLDCCVFSLFMASGSVLCLLGLLWAQEQDAPMDTHGGVDLNDDNEGYDVEAWIDSWHFSEDEEGHYCAQEKDDQVDDLNNHAAAAVDHDDVECEINEDDDHNYCNDEDEEQEEEDVEVEEDSDWEFIAMRTSDWEIITMQGRIR